MYIYNTSSVDNHLCSLTIRSAHIKNLITKTILINEKLIMVK